MMIGEGHGPVAHPLDPPLGLGLNRSCAVSYVVFCRHVSQLETCVKSIVRPWCGERAAHMTSILVNVSADLSYKCSARHHHHGSSVTTVS